MTARTEPRLVQGAPCGRRVPDTSFGLALSPAARRPTAEAPVRATGRRTRPAASSGAPRGHLVRALATLAVLCAAGFGSLAASHGTAHAQTDGMVGPAPATVTITAETGPVVVNAYHSADFTLERSGPTDAGLEVTIAITQTDTYTFDRPWTATFGVGSSQATLSLPVVALSPRQSGTMIATVQSGEGYVAGSPGSAELSMLVLDPVMHIGYAQMSLSVDEDVGRATVELVATSVEGAPAPNDDYSIQVALSTTSSSSGDNAATTGDDYGLVTDEFEFRASDFQIENGRWVARIQVGTVIHDDELHEGEETFVYLLERSASLGGAIQIAEPARITVTIVDDDPPEVESVALTSDPGGDATYAIGDTVEATVTFLGAVTVDTTGGRPGLELDFDGTAKPAAYDSGSGSTALVFHYQVAEDDNDADGIAIAANRLTLNRGTISASTDTMVGAMLTHAAVPAQAAHRVDGVRPTLSSAATASDGTSIVLTFSEPLDEDTGPSDTDFTVNVDGSGAALSGAPAVSGPTVTLTLASAVTFGQTVTVGYTDPTPSNDANAVQDTVGNDADSFTVEAMTNNVPASNDATLRTLAVSDGGAAVPLTPAFDPATTVYDASVTNAVATVTVTATANDEDAEVAFLDEGGAALPDADRNTPEHQVTLDVGDNLIQARVTAENSATTTTYTVTVTRRVAAPALVSVVLTSDPDATGPDDDTYAIDDMVRATVTFSAAVTVDTTGGRPGLELDFDGTAKPAAYDSGSGSTALVFHYQVAEDDNDADGIAIAANRLTLNRGTITASSDTLVGAVLTHPAVPTDTGHRVDGVRPTLTGASVNRRELILTWSEALNEGSAPGGEAFTVHVTGGTAPLVLDVSVSGMTANLFLSAPVSSTDTVTLDYTPPIPDPFQEVQSSLPFEDEAGNDAEAFTARTVTNDTSAPTVVSVALTSDPDATGPDDDTYAIDDVVRATVTFSEAVTVDTTGGRPGLELDFDGTPKPAAYESGSGSTVLVFTYQVAENDADADGIAIGANRLTLNRGTITASSDTLVGAVLTHAAVLAQAGHRVDAVRPALTGASVNRRELTLTWSEALNEGSTPQGEAFTVHVTGGTAPSVTDVSVRGMTATLVLSAPVSSTDTVTLDYTLPLSNPFEDEAGNDAGAFTARTVTNDTSPPAVVSVALTSDPDATGPDDDTYAIDDVVRATVTFSETVTVDDMSGASPPMLELDFDGTPKSAAYESGSGSTALVFRYDVVEDDIDDDGIAIAASRLTLNGGTITASSDTLVGAVLTHTAVTADTGHRVDGVRPTLSSAATASDGASIVLTFSEPLDEDDGPSDTDFTVEVGGAVAALGPPAVAGRTVTLTLATAVTFGQTVTVGYTDPTPGNDANAVQDTVGNDADSFTGEAVTNAVPASNDASLRTLAVRDGGTAVPLTPIFDPATAVYDASVTNAVATVTVTATANDEDAQVAFLDEHDAALPDADGNTPEHQVALDVGDNLIRVRVTAEDAMTIETYTVTVTRRVAAPTVVAVALTSDPDATGPDDDTYAIDDVVRATVTFTAAVTVGTTGGRPGLELDFDGTAKPATYESGSGSTALVFRYDVAEDDAAADGIAIGANRLTLNGGTISASSDTMVGAVLTHAAVPAEAGHRVDGVRPTLSSAASASDGASIVLTLSEPLDEDNGPSDTNFTVRVDGSGAALSAPPAVSGPTVTLTLASAVTFGQAVTVSYTDPTAGNDANALQDTVGNDADSFTGEAVTNTVPASNDATLRTLAVSDGGAAVPLTPAFDPATTVYRASVTNAVATVTVTATANDENAEVAFLDEGGAALPDADRNTPEHQVTLDVGDNLIQARVTAENSATTTTYTVTVTRRVAAPAVVSVALTSDPDATGPDDDTYAIDDMVRATVTFSAAVTVDTTGGRPGLELDFDGTAKPAAYDSGSGSTALVFRYDVAEDDADADGIAIGASRLTLNGGTISASSDTMVGAVLTHPAVPAAAAHRVDAVRPTLSSAATASDGASIVLTFSEPLDEDNGPLDTDFTVNVDGSVAALSGPPAVSGGTATLTLATAVTFGQAATVGYTDPTSGNDANAVQDTVGNDADSFTGEAVTNTVPASNDATLRALAVSDGGTAVPLTPVFDPATAVYDASVRNAVATVTVTATANDEDAEVAFLDEGGAALPDADRNTPEHQVTLDVGDNLIEVRVTAEDAATTRTYTVTVTRRVAAPAVVSVALTSDPDATGPDDDTYAIDDVVRATVTFTAAVTVDDMSGASRPMLELDFDGTAKPAAYDSGSGSTALVFRYDVAVNDADADGIAIAANRLTLNRGTISASSDTLVGAVLTHPAVPADARHRVDGVRPTLSSAASASDGASIVLTLSEPLDEDDGPSDTDFTVRVDGSGAALSGPPAVSGHTVTLTLATAVTFGQAVTVGYTDPTSGNDANAVQDTVGNDADSFTGEAVTNTVPASNDATLRALAVSDGGTAVPLTPVFDPATAVYDASVRNAVATVTVTATANDEDAEVAFLDEGGAALPDADRNTPEHQVTLDVGDNLIQARVTAENSATTTTYTVTVTRRVAAPAVVSVALTSDPDATGPDDDTYAIDDMVRATVTFSAAVTVDTTGGRPGLELDFDGTAKPAAYDSGSGSMALVFRYDVAEDDADADGIAIGANRLTLNRGTITASSDTLVGAVLTHAAVPTQAGHRVDGVRPTLSSAASASDGASIVLTFSEPLDEDNGPSVTDFTVRVDGSGAALSGPPAVSAHTVTLTLATAVTFGQTVTVGYTDPTSGNDANAVQDTVGNDADSFTGEAVTNAVPASNDATLRALAVSDGGTAVPLTPIFDPATGVYIASVTYAATTVTVTVTANHEDAEVAFLDEHGAPLPDADRNTPGHQVTLEVGDNLIEVRVTAEDAATTRTYTVTVTRRVAAPGVVSVALTSDPDATGPDDDTYAIDDVVRATVTFSAAVTVGTTGGRPGLELDFDGTAKPAAYESGSGSTALVFRYDVAEDDSDANGIAIGANRLTLNRGTITASSDTLVGAVLTHAAVPAAAAHRVDGVRPTLSSAASASDGASIVLTFSEPLDEDDGPSDTDFTVRVDGSGAALSGPPAVSGRTVTLTLATAVTFGQAATVGYTDPTPGNDANAVQDTVGNDADSFTGEAVTNTVPASNDATLRALAVSDGGAAVPLTPAFDPATGVYNASVTYAATTVTVTVTANDEDAEVAFLDEHGAALPDADGNAPEHQVTLDVGDNLIEVRVTAEDAATTATYTVTVTRRVAAPGVVSVALTSDPDATGPDDDTYAIDDVVRATVTFTAAVTVDDMSGASRPMLELDFDGTAKPAAYDSGSGSTALVFHYQVAEDDNDADGIAIGANRLTLNGGTISASSDTLVGAVLTHTAVPADTGHRVDGVRPTLSSAASASDGASIVLTFSEPLDEDNGPSVTDFTVRVDGSGAALSGPPAVSAHTVTLTLATAVTFGQTVTVGYTDPTSGNDANAVQDTVGNDADSFTGEAVTNAVPASNDATLRALAVSDGGTAVPLTPIFDPATGVYIASVTYAATTVTVTVTANHEDAEVAFLDEHGAPLPDADRNTPGHQVTLEVGDNTIRVRITARDSATTATYTITITRTASSEGTPFAAAWLARFARTVAGQVADAVSGRLEGDSGPHVTVGGERLDGSGEAALARLKGQDGDEGPAKSRTGREILLRSAFHLESGGNETGTLAIAAWGEIASGRFDAETDGLAMDGEVTTALVGADLSAGRWLAGAAFSHGEGEGSLAPATEGDGGKAESRLTSVHPYARVKLGERMSVWGLAGYGTGQLALSTGQDTPIETNLRMRMGAVGARGILVPAPEGEGFELALKTDALWMRVRSNAAGELAGVKADARRLRLLLDASHHFETGDGATLTPRFEVGLRRDGGDAETGAGMEVGAGLRYARSGFTVEGSVRALLAHEASGYEEWGASGSVRVDPGVNGRGISLRVTPTLGAGPSGVERLWSAPDSNALVRETGFEPGRRLDAEVGYGLAAPRGFGVATPYAGLSLADDRERAWRAGARWKLAPDFTLGLEGSRRERAGDRPREALMLRGTLRW